MQDMLKKIIEMDEKARQMKEEAQLEKAATEKEIEDIKHKIYNDYIERAKERIEKNSQIDRESAEKSWEITKAKHKSVLIELEAMYDQNHENWVEEIVNRVLE